MIVEVWSIMVKLRDATMMVINSRMYWLSYNVLLILSQLVWLIDNSWSLIDYDQVKGCYNDDHN